MKLLDLEKKIVNHSGVFLCSRIHDKSETKIFPFEHVCGRPSRQYSLMQIGGLNDFYETFDSLHLFFDKVSGEAAIELASPEQWDSLQAEFSNWLDILSQDEKDDILPLWAYNCLVIGEIPNSGNYLLMPKDGDKKGYLFEFEHDGFEFIEHAPNIVEFIIKSLNPDSARLRHMASHMRFVGENPEIQWWIEEMRDNTGKIVKTYS